ncbi:hypothetical protein CKO42_20360 [Lamprobacter modestohalophilus]|uniref:Uncharacterized protein n=1 Tax=Lamprobacter modestohalophilus TaxID=1064514 RepID=A0A9X0WBY3_9GAMM|nr:hypothetical protein [Lamprobacter modestohalophilus]MBK1620740.1 hypothetical protein [Lamprobacter modestohalophilus]
MTIDDTQSAEQQLFNTGTLVPFRVLDTQTEIAPDQENLFVRVELMLEDDQEEADPEELVEWGAFGFLFALAALSFHDARPRGTSAIEFHSADLFTVADCLQALSFGRYGLRIETDYLRGRSMKTAVTIQPDGRVTLTTWGRGKSALHWLDRLQGKRRLQAVSTGPAAS